MRRTRTATTRVALHGERRKGKKENNEKIMRQQSKFSGNDD